jgi:hypothetical protein
LGFGFSGPKSDWANALWIFGKPKLNWALTLGGQINLALSGLGPAGFCNWALRLLGFGFDLVKSPSQFFFTVSPCLLSLWLKSQPLFHLLPIFFFSRRALPFISFFIFLLHFPFWLQQIGDAGEE